ncbi:alanine--tRNA ligase [Pseudoclavibacter albus]|uniref:alanine--tRNA ligase n=1 Tax=Pseudoclavibacter albus TaxID=272241 RepID=UPI000826CD72|nr:alanine--tRNA ligase [Pseudoclavibacter alba]
MRTAEIRQRYLDFMESKGHLIVPSASLVSDDPSVMFNIAGMVPMVPYLLGSEQPPRTRMADVQKCIRTNDIEEVGKTPRHGTFFQMLGNWSFGDYFKREAITWAWEFLTGPEEEGCLAFPKDRMWATVFETDDEAESLWYECTDIAEGRVQRLGRSDNYWHMGQAGPGGPDSEIFYDLGPEFGPDGGPTTGHDRYVEVWNLVFMQDLLGEVRSKVDFDIIGELPKKNIDTGMGLERIAFIKQGVNNMYEIDEVRPVLDRAAELAGVEYGANRDDDVRLRVIADHVRSGLMLMSDGVAPGNEGRSYILRRLLRRAIRAMRLLGVEGPTLPELLPLSHAVMSEGYPEVAANFERVQRLAYAEEQTFLKTLEQGTAILDEAVKETKAQGSQSLSSKTAFLLHDTFGFPIDLTMEMAEEAGLTVSRQAFDELMSEQRARAKADAKAKRTAHADTSVYSAIRAQGETVFTGYEQLNQETEVLGILKDGVSVSSTRAGETVELILKETALYAESGGQEADSGTILGTGNGFVADVVDVQKPVPGLVSHTVTVSQGEIGVGERVETVVDPAYRRAACQAHSATHLIHAALRDVLGPDAHQSGSYNKAGYMRLDFAWTQPLSAETRSELEEIANSAIRQNYEVVTREMALDEAKAMGARALFGEKYGAVVRMVDIGGEWSRELCGGTHVGSSAEIGIINLVSESSVGSANRRIESLVGKDAFKDFAAERAIVNQLSQNLKAPREQLGERVQDLVQQLKQAQKRIQELEARQLAQRVPELVAGAVRGARGAVVAASIGEVPSGDELRTLVLRVREQLGTEAATVALAGVANERPLVVIATNEASREAGVQAGALVRIAAGVLGGGGGGKDDVAQGGGQDASQIEAALAAVRTELGV